MKGKIEYTKLREKLDTTRLKQELMHRNLTTDGKWRDGLIKRLKINENDDKAFLPKDTSVDWSDIWLR
jgi:hypothetical protein